MAGEDQNTELKRSPLDALHRELGAKMVPFGGWEMPLSYGDGTLAEHMRTHTGQRYVSWLVSRSEHGM